MVPLTNTTVMILDAITAFHTWKMEANDEIAQVSKVAAINQFSILAFSLFETRMKEAGFNNRSLCLLKTLECIPRLLQCCLLDIFEYERSRQQPPGIEKVRSWIRILERGVIAPAMALTRTGAESIKYYQLGFFDPPHGLMDPQCRICLEERLKTIEFTEQVVTHTTLVRLVAENAVVETAFFWISSLSCCYRKLLTRLKVTERNAALELNFLDFDAIPYPLHQDRLFDQFICPISTLPIRYPVGDPNGKTYYERAYIYRWLEDHDTSPVTKRPLRKNQLIEVPGIQALIDSRLQIHQDRMFQEIEKNLNAPIEDSEEKAWPV